MGGKEMSSMLFMLNPMTVIFPPISTIFSHRFKTSFKYLYHLLKFKAVTWYQHVVVLLGSATSYLPWPKFKYDPQLSRAPGVARDLHARMNTYLAEGNTAGLGEVCTFALLDKYRGVLAARKESTDESKRLIKTKTSIKQQNRIDASDAVMRWEVLRYEGSPKLRQKTTFALPRNPQLPKSFAMPVLLQAVVRIRSVQRLAMWKPTTKKATATPPSVDPTGWEIVEGTEKVQHLTENVVIQRQLEAKTFKWKTDWKVWGTVGVTQWSDIKAILDLEAMARAKDDVKAAEAIQKMGLAPRK